MAFLPGENKKIDTAQARDVSFDMMDFVEQVFNDEYALIIGSEVLLNPEKSHVDGSASKTILLPQKKEGNITSNDIYAINRTTIDLLLWRINRIPMLTCGLGCEIA